MTFYEIFFILTPKISDDLFLAINHVFQIFSTFFQIFHNFTLLNVARDPFFAGKNPISENNSLMTRFLCSVRTFTRIRQHYFLKYWGDGCVRNLNLLWVSLT